MTLLQKPTPERFAQLSMASETRSKRQPSESHTLQHHPLANFRGPRPPGAFRRYRVYIAIHR
jgi:hypothetical protein